MISQAQLVLPSLTSPTHLVGSPRKSHDLLQKSPNWDPEIEELGFGFWVEDRILKSYLSQVFGVDIHLGNFIYNFSIHYDVEFHTQVISQSICII